MGLTIALPNKAIAGRWTGDRRASMETDCGCADWSGVAYVQHRYLAGLSATGAPHPSALTVAE
jgi:hypothetical protein